MQERLIIDVSRLKPDGERIEGEVDAIDVAEEFVHPFGGIRYSLFVQVIGTELLVRGRAEQDFDLVCSRCGKDFDTTIKAEDITASVALDESTDEIDLTDEIREAVLLELPNYPLCDENCEGIEGVGNREEVRGNREEVRGNREEDLGPIGVALAKLSSK